MTRGSALTTPGACRTPTRPTWRPRCSRFQTLVAPSTSAPFGGAGGHGRARRRQRAAPRGAAVDARVVVAAMKAALARRRAWLQEQVSLTLSRHKL